MTVGDPSIFAIESSISQAFDSLSLRGIGYFNVHLGGRSYGVHDPDATMLACSLDGVERRLRNRGCHLAPFSEGDVGSIASAFREAEYGQEYGSSYTGIPAESFAEIIRSNHITWAPDGDEAFDDGSYVLQFDLGDQVRIVAFKNRDDGHYDPSTVSDLWLHGELYYDILERWVAGFLAEWDSLPKVKA